MKKRLCAALLAVCLAVALLPVTAEAAIRTSGECGMQGANLTWTLDDAGTLTISGNGEMASYGLGMTGPWGTSDIQKVNIQNGVTSIGYDAFSGCESLTSITIPNSVTTIWGRAFYDCSNLTHITIPNSVSSIVYNAFTNCKRLTSITIPDSITVIETGVFHGCGSLTSIYIPDSVTFIGPDAFCNCSSLADVYYSGTESQWSQIEVDDYNDPLKSAVIHYNYTPSTGAIQLEDGVKYVPYYSGTDDYEITSDTNVRYDLEGTLPSGLSLDPKTAVISGVPMVDGTWNFTIKRTLPDGVKDIPCTLTILSNTDAAVQRPNDYEIIIPVGTPDRNDSNHFYKNEFTEETLKIDGPYDEFYRLLIDGRELTQPDDYTAEEGSTVITIHAETFQRFGEGTHTIAAEFRPTNARNDPSQTKRVAQNYTLQLSQSSSGGSGNGSGGRSKPSINTNAQKPQQPQQATPFSDVISTEWYYEDVVWAYQEGLMQGIDGTHFGPDEKVSQATIVTVLARLAQIDLSQFEGETEPDVPAGQYYTAAAIWAKRAGLMPSGGTFTGSEVTTRDQMAVMLTRYLTSMGKDTTPPAQPVTFEDAAGMSQEGGNAFQVLYQYGIFRGTGGMKMEPNGSTTRAQFVALMHRIYDTAVS